MKRHAVVVLTLAALASLVVGIAGARTQQDRRSTITISSSTADVRLFAVLRADVLYLFNRDVQARPIGHAVLSCRDLGSGGVLGSGLFTCSATYVLPLGKITASGIVHSFRRYTLVVNGGTGAYLGAAGSVFTRRVGPGDNRVVITL